MFAGRSDEFVTQSRVIQSSRRSAAPPRACQREKTDVLARGHKVVSETDSELFGFLVLDEMKAGKSLFDAVA